MLYYRISTHHDNSYNIEESVDKNKWTVSQDWFNIGWSQPASLPRNYKTLFFAKWKVLRLLKKQEREDAYIKRKQSHVPKVVYGPYP